MEKHVLVGAMRRADISVDQMNDVLERLGMEKIEGAPMHNLYPSKKIVDMLFEEFKHNRKVKAVKELRGIFSVMSGYLPLENFRGYLFYDIVKENNFQIEPRKVPETTNYVYFKNREDHDLVLLREKLTGQPAGTRMFTCTMCDGKHYFA